MLLSRSDVIILSGSKRGSPQAITFYQNKSISVTDASTVVKYSPRHSLAEGSSPARQYVALTKRPRAKLLDLRPGFSQLRCGINNAMRSPLNLKDNFFE